MKFCAIFVLAITLNVALGMSFRHKRQSPDDEENDLDDRYGWNRPNSNSPWENRPQRPNRPLPNQGGNQWPLPNQGGNGQNGQQNQFPTPNQGGQPQPTPAPNGNGSTTQSSTVQDCIRRCPVTSEYNPVCGSDMVQYPNPGRLSCAQTCGVNVNLFRASACPTTTVAPAG